MATPAKPAKSRAKTPSQKFWTPQRNAAFEAVRCGEKAGVPDSTLRSWEADPRWQAKLAKREDQREAVAVSLEIERVQLLEAVCTAGIRYWDEVLKSPNASEFAKLAATRESWALKLRLDAQSQQRQLTRVWDFGFSATVWVSE